MNVLFLSGGRRVTLAEMFMDRGFKVVAYESDVKCPLSKHCEIIEATTKYTDGSIYGQILSIMKEKKCELVIPLSDEAAYMAASYGLSVCCSMNGAFACYDKSELERKMKGWLSQYYPWPTKSKYPLIYKPIHGYGSKGIIKENSWWFDESKHLLRNPQTHIAQRFINGTEYSVDAYFNTAYSFLGASVRTRDRVGDGEVINSTIVAHKRLREAACDIGKHLSLRGPVCMQFIESSEDYSLNLLEINGRFGGGATLSIHAGFDMIDMIKKEYVLNERVMPENYEARIGTQLKRVYKDYYFQ